MYEIHDAQATSKEETVEYDDRPERIQGNSAIPEAFVLGVFLDLRTVRDIPQIHTPWPMKPRMRA